MPNCHNTASVVGVLSSELNIQQTACWINTMWHIDTGLKKKKEKLERRRRTSNEKLHRRISQHSPINFLRILPRTSLGLDGNPWQHLGPNCFSSNHIIIESLANKPENPPSDFDALDLHIQRTTTSSQMCNVIRWPHMKNCPNRIADRCANCCHNPQRHVCLEYGHKQTSTRKLSVVANHNMLQPRHSY